MVWHLQAPLQRTAIGFDSADYALDVQIAPDRTWNWKDEDEFESVQERGVFSVDEASEIRAEGDRVIATIEANEWPFNAGWEHWRPDSVWPIPSLPVRWDSQ